MKTSCVVGSHSYFTHKVFKIWAPSNQNIWQKFMRPLPSWDCYPYWFLKCQKVECWLKDNIIVCKNAKYFITSSSFAQFRNSRYHQNQEIISYNIWHWIEKLGTLLANFQIWAWPQIWPLKCVFRFFRIGNFGLFCRQISSVALCVQLTEFLDNLFKMPIFKPKFKFFEILKVNLVKHPKRVMTIKFIFQIFLFSGAKVIKKYCVWKIVHR